MDIRPFPLNLAEAARRELSNRRTEASLEQAWREAALFTLATDQVHLPDVFILKPLTAVSQTWAALPYSLEAVQDRIGCLRDCHHLAIALNDADWLTDLLDCWLQAPNLVDELWILRARGEISLGLQFLGYFSQGWSSEDLDWLVEESFLRLDVPSDQAWWFLAQNNRSEARRAVREYETRLSRVKCEWEREPEQGLPQILAYPSSVMHVELNALTALTRDYRPNPQRQ